MSQLQKRMGFSVFVERGCEKIYYVKNLTSGTFLVARTHMMLITYKIEISRAWIFRQKINDEIVVFAEFLFNYLYFSRIFQSKID